MDKNAQFPILVLFAIASISGLLGGCAASGYYLTHALKVRVAFVVAYIMLGVAFGVLTLAGLTIIAPGHVGTVPEVILYSLGGGAAGAIMLASANTTVSFIFRRLGLEVRFTFRRDKENRRESDDNSQ